MTQESDPRISGYLDGELSPEERARFEADLARSPELRKEVDAMRSVKDVTGSMAFEEFPDHVWDRYWDSTASRLERRVGWTLVSLGLAILIGAALYQVVPDLVRWLVQDPTTPWWLRLGTGLLCLGVGVLVVSLVRERIVLGSRDPYRKVKR